MLSDIKDLGLCRLLDRELGGAALEVPVEWGVGADLCLSAVERGVLEIVDDLELPDDFLRVCLGRGGSEAVVINRDGALLERG